MASLKQVYLDMARITLMYRQMGIVKTSAQVWIVVHSGLNDHFNSPRLPNWYRYGYNYYLNYRDNRARLVPRLNKREILAN